MIGYLEGTLLKIEEDRILLLVDHIGYEILLPAFVMDRIRNKQMGDATALYIYHQQTERQPKPVLIGFDIESDKDFFSQFISVEDIGPLKAAKAMTIPVGEIAMAIESKDAAVLHKLKGIGQRTAQKIIAALSGKLAAYTDQPVASQPKSELDSDVPRQVVNVLISQLGYKSGEAKRMVADVLSRKGHLSTPEELFDEIFRNADQR